MIDDRPISAEEVRATMIALVACGREQLRILRTLVTLATLALILLFVWWVRS